MAQPTIQTSFASGEWAPKLRSRVDIQKYHSGAELLRNFYVDYSGGGASTRSGTRFCNQCGRSGSPVRIIGFQPSTTVSYVLEFGDFYIRFYSNGAPILESPIAITSISGNSITTASNPYVVGDWVAIGSSLTNVMYYIVVSAGATFTVSDLFGNTSVTPSGSAVARVYTLSSPYSAADLFPNPITGNPGIKFVPDVTSLVITHPTYPPQLLTIIAPNQWTISAISFNSTIASPTGLVASTTLTALASGWNYGYLITAVDTNGQESAPTAPVLNLTGLHGLYDTTAVGTNLLTWTAVGGATSYNVYKTEPSFNTSIQTGAQYGFIGNVTGVAFTDAFPGIAPDFSQTPPVLQNPFSGASVMSYTVTASGTYTTVPGVIDSGGGGIGATAQASLGVITAAINAHGAGPADINVNNGSPSPVGSLLTFSHGGVTLAITAATFISSGPGSDAWEVNSVSINGPGSITFGSTPTNPVPPTGCNATGFQSIRPGFNFNLTWGVTSVIGLSGGAGYTSPPSVAFSAGAATATATLGLTSAGNPGCVNFIQERLTFASQPRAPQSFNMSQPGSFFNFNTTFPVEDDDAISAQIIAEDLNDIRSMIQVPTGLLMFTGKAAWLANGGGGISTQVPITPSNITAQSQAFNGANDLPPKKINFDLLYVTNKGNYVRDLTYNLYAQIFTGSDISVLSNHLFFGHYLTDWAWSEEPFKTLWAIRDDGQMLSLGYVKEQELTGWAHHDTNGQFLSVCSVIETVNGNTVDAVYVVVRRFVNNQYVQYVERMADRYFPYGYEDSWSVDCALQTVPQVNAPTDVLVFTGDGSAIGNTVTITDRSATPFTVGMVGWTVRAGGGIYKITAFNSTAVVTTQVVRVPAQLNPYTNTPLPITTTGLTIWQPVTTITGLTQLEGQTVTGVADGAVVPPTIVSAGGSVTLGTAATKITLGLAFQPQMKTLRLDLGEPTVQSKRKKIPAASLRVADTLGLQIGTKFANVVTMKDFQIGAIPMDSNGPASITDLYSGDGRTILDQVWQEPGQLCVQQNLPYPATILGIMPEVVVGDTPDKGGGR